MQRSRTDDADKTKDGEKAGPKMEREEAYKEAGPMMVTNSVLLHFQNIIVETTTK